MRRFVIFFLTLIVTGIQICGCYQNSDVNQGDTSDTLLDTDSNDTEAPYFRMAKNIHEGTVNSWIGSGASANGLYYFGADDGYNGRELWVSDGSESGTRMLKDIVPGIEGASFRNFFTVNNKMFISINDRVHGSELWISDGTESGTELVKDIFPGENSGPGSFAKLGSELFFVADDEIHGGELWKSDGIQTSLVTDIHLGPESSEIMKLLQVNNSLFFFANDGIHGTQLWISDGTSAGTHMVIDLSDGLEGPDLRDLVSIGSNVLFVIRDGPDQLWRSDGTVGGTVMIKDISSQWEDNVGYMGSERYHYSLTPVGEQVFFHFYDDINGDSLWKTDGTSQGTQMVKNICNPDRNDGMLNNLVAVDQGLFFIGNDQIHGPQLWRSDGTENGTTMVTNFEENFSINSSHAIGSTLYFATSITMGSELWVSDGTTSGTKMLKDIQPGRYGSYPVLMSEFNDALIFKADDGFHGEELWKTDGTQEGTTLIADIAKRGNGSNPDKLEAVSDLLYFVANDGIHGEELWVSDGTENGTNLVKDILSVDLGNPGIDYLTASGDKLFFVANDDTHGYELWVSNGSQSGTKMVKDIHEGDISSTPGALTVFEDALYFTASHELGNYSLWVTDGTAYNTAIIKENIGATQIISAENKMFIVSRRNQPHCLWISDGTTGGTVKIKQQEMDNNISSAALFKNELYFSINNSDQRQLWKSDGTATGTVPISGALGPNPDIDLLVPVGNLLFIVVDQNQLWTLDGVSQSIKKVAEIKYDGVYATINNITAVGGKAFFTAHKSLWVSDGTAAGTILLGDEQSAIEMSPQNLLERNKLLYFSAVDELNGREMWTSDGTKAGTKLLKDMAPNESKWMGSNYPAILTEVGNKLFFIAEDGQNGVELWVTNQ